MHTAPDPKLVDQAVKTIQMLAVDGVQKANSGHPGAPMGLASIAFEIWQQLRFDPAAPQWLDRDRFVLSCGHASMLLYSLLHLSGYDLPMEQLKSFRQWGSKTPGHPEVHLTAGVEMTTGPLGQGIATAVGIALGLKMLAARFNPGRPDLITGRVFGIASDGDMMEGISAEASSLAGHLGLDNLVFFYDDNGITIDGKTDLSFSENVGKRYEAYGWHVLHVNGHDHPQIRQALKQAIDHRHQPCLIVAKTHIGKGSPNKQDKSSAHGSPLGDEEIRLTKQALGLAPAATFVVPAPVRALFAARAQQGARAHAAWRKRKDEVLAGDDALAAAFAALTESHVPDNLLQQLMAELPDQEAATRVLSGKLLQRVAALVPALVGGSADLTPSTKTHLTGFDNISRDHFSGRNFHFGIREHGMAAVVNGLALTGGWIPFGATFLVFSDYLRPAIRLAALSHLRSIFVFTHDSVYLGEDGPTHQPVEHYWALRVIPNHDLVRPADAMECAAAWSHALARTDGPTSLSLTRQAVPPLARPDDFDPCVILRGAYILDDSDGPPAAVVIATGSEVHIAVAAKALLGEAGKGVRVVSAPCLDAFERQQQSYRDSVLPPGVKRASIEVGITQPWRGVVGDGGLTLGHDGFGYSAPWKTIRKALGLDAEGVATRLRQWL